MGDFESTKHPHEPARVPVYDESGRCLVCVEITLLDQIERLRRQLDEAQLRSIEARNPGIDMERVKRERAGR